MTGFATANGEQGPYRWTWEIRSVNGRGLDMRLRLPDWVGGLEQAVRGAVTGRIARGSVTIALRLNREPGDAAVQLDRDVLDATLAALKRIETAALEHSLRMAAPSPTEVMALRGVVQTNVQDEDTAPLLKALMDGFDAVLDALDDMRAAEGAALAAVLHDQLGSVEAMIGSAMHEAEQRGGQTAANLRANLARVLDHADGADETRVAQELALIAVKADIREELDRLEAHVLAARELLAGEGPVGRRLDFLMQEFNREANTVCSKSQSTQLTRIGLDLKAAIDQMREQVQNVE